MSLRPKNLALPVVALALATLPVCGAQEVTSATHPVLERALAERPELDQDDNGVLSLQEYQALPPKPAGEEPVPEGKQPFLPVLPGGEVVISEFEDNNNRNAKGWTNEGNAFQVDLDAGTRLMKRRVGPYLGRFFLSSMASGGDGTGRLLSPEFPIELDYLSLSMSGGDFPQRLGVNLWVGEELVRTATGTNDDYFEEVAFEVREFRGRMARVELLDHERGPWGHLNLDRLVMTSTSAAGARVIASKPTPVISRDGVALTINGPLHGPLEVRDGQLRSLGTPFPAENLLLALNPRRALPESASGALQLIDGETWQARIGNLQDGALTINSPLFGERKVSLARIARIDFQRGLPHGGHGELGHLYRTTGEPIPGKLVWVRDKDIAIDCPLGVVPIPRETVTRFVIAKPQPPAERHDDAIGLMDGTILYGKATLAGSQIAVAHPILGELRLDWSAIRSLRRALPGVTWLEGFPITVAERIGPALPPPAPQWVTGRGDSHLRALRLMPHSVTQFTLESGPDRNRILRTQLATVPGCLADVQVTILAGETTLWTQRLLAGAAPIPLSLDLSNSEELTIRVDFDGPLAFPCGIDLRDPHLLNLATIQSDPGQP